MFHSITSGDRLYRVTALGQTWPDPMQGLGAYFNKGGRFNRVSQATVYCAEDPLVVLSELAFYQALEWQHAISMHRFMPVSYPLLSEHCLWCFSLDPSPSVIDLEHTHAVHQFQYPPHLLLNPSLNPRHGPQLAGQPANRDYLGTQELADEIRAFNPPAGAPFLRPEGVKAPSVRTPGEKHYSPHLFALFVFDPNLNIHVPFEQRARLIDQWEIQLEFLQASPRRQINSHTVEIDWKKPRFRLRANMQVLPTYAGRPGSKSYNPNRWYNLKIRYA